MRSDSRTKNRSTTGASSCSRVKYKSVSVEKMVCWGALVSFRAFYGGRASACTHRIPHLRLFIASGPPVQSASVRGRQVRSPVLPQDLLRRLVAVPQRSSRIRKVASREERVDEQEPRAAESAEGSGDGADSRHSGVGYASLRSGQVRLRCMPCYSDGHRGYAALCQLLHLRREPTRARRPPFCNLLISRFRGRPNASRGKNRKPPSWPFAQVDCTL